jgi:hypothetical protein
VIIYLVVFVGVVKAALYNLADNRSGISVSCWDHACLKKVPLRRPDHRGTYSTTQQTNYALATQRKLRTSRPLGDEFNTNSAE